MGTFIVSIFLSKDWRIRPVDIQNATLAGGVAVGAVCHMTLALSDSMLIGFAGGVLSSVGYAKVQPFLEELGLHDSCGINNLHGMPSLLGGAASIILVAYKGPKGHDYPAVLTHTESAYWHQLGAVGFTLLVAISSGLATGFVLRFLKSTEDTLCYDDSPFWEVAEESYEPAATNSKEPFEERSQRKPENKKVLLDKQTSKVHPYGDTNMEDGQ
jgi:ammonium transporter Rh